MKGLLPQSLWTFKAAGTTQGSVSLGGRGIFSLLPLQVPQTLWLQTSVCDPTALVIRSLKSRCRWSCPFWRFYSTHFTAFPQLRRTAGHPWLLAVSFHFCFCHHITSSDSDFCSSYKEPCVTLAPGSPPHLEIFNIASAMCAMIRLQRLGHGHLWKAVILPTQSCYSGEKLHFYFHES